MLVDGAHGSIIHLSSKNNLFAGQHHMLHRMVIVYFRLIYSHCMYLFNLPPLSLCPSVCLARSLSICLSVSLSLSLHLCLYLCLCLSVCLSLPLCLPPSAYPHPRLCLQLRHRIRLPFLSPSLVCLYREPLDPAWKQGMQWVACGGQHRVGDVCLFVWFVHLFCAGDYRLCVFLFCSWLMVMSFPFWWGIVWGLLGFVLFYDIVHSLHLMFLLLANLMVSMSVFKISLPVVFNVFSPWISGHSSSMCFCISIAILQILHSMFSGCSRWYSLHSACFVLVCFLDS